MEAANARHGHQPVFLETLLACLTTALSAEFSAVCVSVSDRPGGEFLGSPAQQGTRLNALRSAGFNTVGLSAVRMSHSGGSAGNAGRGAC